MDTIKNKPILTLDKEAIVLNSYNFLIMFFFIFIILIIVLMQVNKDGFNVSFGKEIFVTLPILLVLVFLVKEIFKFQNNIEGSLFSMFSQSTRPWFIPVIYLLIVLLGIFGLSMMMYVGGIFSDNPPENNTAMLINFIIIFGFILISGIMYKNYQTKDDTVLKNLPVELQNASELRTKYTAIFALFVIFVMLLYFVNPKGIMTDYGGPVVFFSLFVGIILMILITIYQYYLANPSKANFLKNEQGFTSYLLKGLYILVALAISGGLIYGALKFMGVFEQDASTQDSLSHIIFNLVLFCAMLGVIYKLANAGGFLDKNPYYRLILNTFLYIPCLLVSIFNYIGQLFGFIKGLNGTGSGSGTAFKPFEYKMLLLSLVLLLGYFSWFFFIKPFFKTKYLKQGGQQLINQPIQTNILTNVVSYQSLSGTDTFNYRYAISFWFYLDSFPPSTNSSYLKVVPILSYGLNPSIKYSSVDNTLYITVKQKTDGNSVVDYIQEIKPETVEKWKNTQENISDAIEKVKEMPFGKDLDAEGHRIIYKHPDVLLQKWNNLILNYNGGTLDVFYNGKLVKSAIEVVPYMTFDMLTVGTENGISGNVANLIYFKEPLDILTINTLYTSLKDKNPPSISENSKTLIPINL